MLNFPPHPAGREPAKMSACSVQFNEHISSSHRTQTSRMQWRSLPAAWSCPPNLLNQQGLAGNQVFKVGKPGDKMTLRPTPMGAARTMDFVSLSAAAPHLTGRMNGWINAVSTQKGPNREKEELCSMVPFNERSHLLSKEWALSTAVSSVLAIDEIDHRGDKQERMLGALSPQAQSWGDDSPEGSRTVPAWDPEPAEVLCPRQHSFIPFSPSRGGWRPHVAALSADLRIPRPPRNKCEDTVTEPTPHSAQRL